MTAENPGRDRPIIDFRFDQIAGERATTLTIVRPDGISLDPIRFGNVTESAARLRTRLPDILAPLREVAGIEGASLEGQRATDASKFLYNVGGQIAEALVDDNRGRQLLGQWRAQIAGFFEGTEPFGFKPAPLIRITASGADDFASLLPIEFLPVAGDIIDRRNVLDCAQSFLGFRALIFRNLVEDRARVIARAPDGRIGTRLMMHDDPALDAVRDQQRFFNDNSQVFATQTWPDGHHDPKEQPYEAFVRCLSGSSEIVHLCSHYGDIPGSTDSAFDFGSAKVRVSQLRGELNGLADASRPFLFLNACSTGAVRSWDDSLIRTLVRHLFTDLIATETLLPQSLAAFFCRYFYSRLLAQPPVDIATALLGARHDLLRQKNNPGGIFYRYYGTPRLHVAAGSALDPNKGTSSGDEMAVGQSWSQRMGRVLRSMSGRFQPTSGHSADGNRRSEADGCSSSTRTSLQASAGAGGSGG